MIFTSRHPLEYSNTKKRLDLSIFVKEYRRVMGLILDSIWNEGYKNFDPKKNKYELPKYLRYKDFGIDTPLTGRALSYLVAQLLGMIRAQTKKQAARLFILRQKNSKSGSLIKSIKSNIPHKPNVERVNPEIGNLCFNWKFQGNLFLGFLKLRCLMAGIKDIKIPIISHLHSKKIEFMGGTRMGSISIQKDLVGIRWYLPDIDPRSAGTTLGVDQGIKDVLVLSNGAKTPKTCPHGHTLESILRKIDKKKRGGRAFARAQDHRKNFINWSINRLNLSGIKEIRFEKIWNMGFKNGVSGILKHWTNTLIRDKVEKVCKENGVRFVLQSSTYRSQRCNECGQVRKANRKGKIYSCKNCGLEIDADLNAAKNHEQDLPEIPWTLRSLNKNRKDGFFWLSSGFFDLEGRSLESLPPVEAFVYSSPMDRAT